MRHTLKVKWLDDMTPSDFVVMIERLPKFVPSKQVAKKENRDDIKLPMFNLAFDECCRHLGRIPSQEEYADYYIEKAENIIKKHRLNRRQIRERCNRNIFSFIQEYAIYVVLNDSGYDGLFDRGWDFKGVDFIVNTEKKGRFGILSHAGTPSSIQKSRMKDKLRRHRVDFECIELHGDISKLGYYNGIHLFTKMSEIKSCIVPKFYLGA